MITFKSIKPNSFFIFTNDEPPPERLVVFRKMSDTQYMRVIEKGNGRLFTTIDSLNTCDQDSRVSILDMVG